MKEQSKYSAELKAEAVKMVIEQGLTQKETGKRLSIPKGNIGNWVSAAKAGLKKGSPGEQSVAEKRRRLMEARRTAGIRERPRYVDDRPWEIWGVSRRSWERYRLSQPV